MIGLAILASGSWSRWRTAPRRTLRRAGSSSEALQTLRGACLVTANRPGPRGRSAGPGSRSSALRVATTSGGGTDAAEALTLTDRRLDAAHRRPEAYGEPAKKAATSPSGSDQAGDRAGRPRATRWRSSTWTTRRDSDEAVQRPRASSPTRSQLHRGRWAPRDTIQTAKRCRSRERSFRSRPPPPPTRSPDQGRCRPAEPHGHAGLAAGPGAGRRDRAGARRYARASHQHRRARRRLRDRAGRVFGRSLEGQGRQDRPAGGLRPQAEELRLGGRAARRRATPTAGRSSTSRRPTRRSGRRSCGPGKWDARKTFVTDGLASSKLPARPARRRPRACGARPRERRTRRVRGRRVRQALRQAPGPDRADVRRAELRRGGALLPGGGGGRLDRRAEDGGRGARGQRPARARSTPGSSCPRRSGARRTARTSTTRAPPGRSTWTAPATRRPASTTSSGSRTARCWSSTRYRPRPRTLARSRDDV